MSVWSNLQSRHHLTGAIRTLSVDLLADVSLAPQQNEPDWDVALALSDAPWRESYAAMPRQVRPSVARGFADLVRATATARLEQIDAAALPEGRARHHLQGLLDLGAALGALPADLAVARYVVEYGTCLEPLPMCPSPFGFDSTLEEALHTRLSLDHGTTTGMPLVAAPAATGCALRHVQDALLGKDAPVTRDHSLHAYGVRDTAMQADLAAAMVRGHLDAGVEPGDIAVMLPDEGQGADLLAAAFDGFGIPLGGVPEVVPRDNGAELLLLVVQLLRSAPPPMVAAALCLSPLMPWEADEGRAMARSVMENGSIRDLPDWFRQTAGSSPRSFRALLGRVSGLTADLRALKPLISRLAALSPADIDTPLEWDSLMTALQSATTEPIVGARFADAVALWSGGSEPLRPVRHLIVAGFAGNVYPRGVGANPLFLDSELRLISDRLGLQMPTRASILRRNLERFRRQMGAVSETLVFVVPRRELNGDRLHPAPGLALIAPSIAGLEKPEDLIVELTSQTASEWTCTTRIVPQRAHHAPVLPADGVVRTGRDLLRLREGENGHMKPQSPSRLENMLSSPLVWVMREAGAQPREWLPRGLDVMTQGSLFHAVLETLFPKDQAVADIATLLAGFPAAFDAAVGRKAPFLNDALWVVERSSLESDAQRMVVDWRARLEELGARVVGNEQPLSGDALGIRLSGFADAVLVLPDGHRMVVDFKAASSGKRRTRMEKGWDLQVALYRAMIARPGNDETAALATDGEVGIAYHLLRDGVTLASGPGSDGPGVECVPGDISREAQAQLQITIAELGGGTLRLNGVGDVVRFEKETGATPYGLKEDALAQKLVMPDAAQETSA